MNSNATFNRFRGLVWLVLMAVVWLSAGTRGRAATADVSARFNDWKDVGCRNRYGGMPDMSFNATGGKPRRMSSMRRDATLVGIGTLHEFVGRR
ncbi:MAG: hypothetical protein NTX27_14660 [Verrucomicrobia bacterium]|nr:hypothetical protein [Verrucomicrobiota bacterium]